METVMNFIQLESMSILTDSFAYIDTKDHAGEPVFLNHGLKVKLEKEYEKEGYPYCIIVCKIRKGNADDFMICMQKIANKILLSGHFDYADFCQELYGKWRKYVNGGHNGR